MYGISWLLVLPLTGLPFHDQRKRYRDTRIDQRLALVAGRRNSAHSITSRTSSCRGIVIFELMSRCSRIHVGRLHDS